MQLEGIHTPQRKFFRLYCKFSSQDSLLEEEQAEKEDRQFFFTPLEPMFENDPEEDWPSDDFMKPRKEHCRSKWRHSQDAVY